jgi:AraC family transcriptional regulator
MFRPESDWEDQQASRVANFAIEHRLRKDGIAADIRRWRWIAPDGGALSPASHYLDYSLSTGRRRSTIRAEGWSEACASGRVVYLPPHREYWGVPAVEDRRILCVALSDDFLTSVIEDERLLSTFSPSADLQGPLLQRLMESLAMELAAPGFASDTMTDAMLLSIAVELARSQSGVGDLSGDGEAPGHRQVRAIRDFVMDNLGGQLGIAEIARACGMSTRHVARVFKAGTGTSLGDFVARNRMALAKELLGRGDLAIKEISWRCGFRSTSAFCAAFRAVTGATPRVYRDRAPRLH